MGRQRAAAQLVLSGAAGALFWATVLVLAFDTATPAVTIAVSDERRVLARRGVVDARRPGEVLAAGIRRGLAAAGGGRRGPPARRVRGPAPAPPPPPGRRRA